MTTPIAQRPVTKQAAKAAYLAALIDAASPYIVGVIHAEKGEPCDPSDMYLKQGDAAEFVEGYRSVLPAPTSQPQRRMLGVGRIQGGERNLSGHSLFDSRELVEHTVDEWATGKVMAEARVNGRLLFRRKFEGDNAASDAAAWCDGTAPIADKLPGSRVPVVVPASFEDDDAMLDIIFAPVVEDEYEFAIEDDQEWIRQGC